MIRTGLILVLAMSSVAMAEDAKKGKAAPAAKPAAAPKMDPQMAAMMAAYEKAAAVGPEHKKLAELLGGDWTVEVKSFMGPGEPQKSTGTAKGTAILDGRFVMQEDHSTMMGKPFEGHMLIGYDNVSKKYQTTWVDNMGTGISTGEGTFDASGKVLTITSSHNDAMTGKVKTERQVNTFESDKKHTVEIFMTGPDGKEVKGVEISFTRK